MKYLKTIIALVVAIVVSAGAFAAAKTDADVDAYKLTIISSLKQQGYTAKEDRDGDLQFAKEQKNYWIRVQAYDDGYYVSLFTVRSIAGMNIEKVREAMDRTMGGLLFVRMYTTSNEDNLIIQYNWYCTSAADFNRLFKSAVSVVALANTRFTDNYLK